jgi:hypothetical protein
VSNLNWGWRLQCSHPGCTKTIEKWSDKGTPPLEGCYGYHTQGFAQGWFVGQHQLSTSTHPHDNHGHAHWRKPGHRSFCPQHAEPVVTWIAERVKWEGIKHRAAQDLVPVIERTWRARLAAWVNPPPQRTKYQEWQRIVDMDMREWVKANPPPCPPWEVR